MVFTETHKEGYFDRLKKAIGGVVIGLVLFLASFWLLWWNEGNSLNTIASIDEFKDTYVAIPTDKVDPQNEKKPIYTAGKAVTYDILQDSIFPISMNAMQFSRKVEMYQWEEHEHKRKKETVSGKKTTYQYTYQGVWSETYHDSNKFKDPEYKGKNPPMPIQSDTIYATNIELGAFNISSLKKSIQNNEHYAIPLESYETWRKELKSQYIFENGGLYRPFYKRDAITEKNNSDKKISVQDHEDLPISAIPAEAEIGDIRITFFFTPPQQDVTIIGEQSGNTFTQYLATPGKLVGHLSIGIVPADIMIKTEKDAAILVKWFCRLGGFIMMWLGLFLILQPLAMIVSFIPFLKDIIASGIGIATALIAIMLSSTTIAIAWLRFRPLYAVVAVFLIIFLSSIIRNRANRARQQKENI